MLRFFMDPTSLDSFPSSARAADPRPLRVVAAVVWNEGRLLMTQRPPGGPLGLQWEFPGGKIEDGETPEEALARELQEELGVTAALGETLAIESHSYPDGPTVEIAFIACTLGSLELRPGRGVHDLRWQRPAEIDLSRVLAGDRSFLVRLGADPGGAA